MLRSQAARFHSLILAIDMALSAWACLAVLSRPEFRAVIQIREPGLEVLAVALAGTFSLPILFDWLGLYASQRRAPCINFVSASATRGRACNGHGSTPSASTAGRGSARCGRRSTSW